ncbi:MAG: RepB family plasmid replication initiator protein [Clostridia bacterium]|nr:RepB family plasmid replication initiator protein [Clostridia bacterium]
MNAEKLALVTKSNALVEAMTGMGLLELRFLAYIASRLPRDLIPQKGVPYEAEIDVKSFIAAFDMNEKSSYREIKAVADRMRETTIEFQDAEGMEIGTGIITKRKYHHGEGRLWFCIDDDLLPHLIDLSSEFTSYRIKDVYQFTSANTWRIYELLKQYRVSGKRDIDTEDLRLMLGLGGKYPRSIDLRRYVIDPAIEEINATSDLLVDYVQKKRGRRVTGFMFVIRDNPGTKTPREKIRAKVESLDSGKSHCPDLEAELRETYGVSAKQARQLANLAKGKEADIKTLLPKIKARFDALASKKTSLGGYVFRAVKAELTTTQQRSLPL